MRVSLPRPPHPLPSPLGRLEGCLEEVAWPSFPVVLRNLFHWRWPPGSHYQLTPGISKGSNVNACANHLFNGT